MKLNIYGENIITKKGCESCDFYSQVCMGYGKRTGTGEYTYGMPIDEAVKMFPNGDRDWGTSLGTYIKENNKDMVIKVESIWK